MTRPLSDFEYPPMVAYTHRSISSGPASVAIPFGEGTIVFPGPLPDWSRESIIRVCELGELPENWDSYGGRVIDVSLALAAIQLILDTFGPAVPAPAVVPTNRGGVQLEWHRHGCDLEIRIESPSRFRIVFDDAQTGEALEQAMAGDLRPLIPLLERISTPGEA